jgi:hypothetical protein
MAEIRPTQIPKKLFGFWHKTAGLRHTGRNLPEPWNPAVLAGIFWPDLAGRPFWPDLSGQTAVLAGMFWSDPASRAESGLYGQILPTGRNLAVLARWPKSGLTGFQRRWPDSVAGFQRHRSDAVGFRYRQDFGDGRLLEVKVDCVV